MKNKKLEICVATKARGIFKETFEDENIDANFNLEAPLFNISKNNDSKILNLVRKIYLSKVGDIFGLVQIIKINGKKCDYYWSYNRFLNCDRPYILYIEHPIAVQHYRIDRNRYFLGKRKIQKCLSNERLKAIVFQAKFSERTFKDLVGNYTGIVKQIYPIVKNNKFVNEQQIIRRCKSEKFVILFSAQASRFVSKCAPELLKAYEKLQKEGLSNIRLEILTQIEKIDEKYIDSYKNITWIDYNLTSEQMEKLYSEATVLVMVSSDDSLNAVALESLKAGLPIISSNMSGFPELVEDGLNGFMTNPKWNFFDQHGYPNKTVWNYRKETIYSEDISERIVEYIYEKIKYLYLNRDKLIEMSLYSLKKGNSKPFSKEYIEQQWNELFAELDNQDKSLPLLDD